MCKFESDNADGLDQLQIGQLHPGNPSKLDVSFLVFQSRPRHGCKTGTTDGRTVVSRLGAKAV